MRRPVSDKYKVTADYPYHLKKGRSGGIDYSGKYDRKVLAPHKGTVRRTKDKYCGNGLRVTDGKYESRLCHMSSYKVATGVKVKEGQQVGVMGYTGYTIPKGPAGRHLHWALFVNGKRVDPDVIMKSMATYKGKDAKGWWTVAIKYDGRIKDYQKKYSNLKATYEKLVKSSKTKDNLIKENDKLIKELGSTLASTKQSNKDKTARLTEITKELQVVQKEIKDLKDQDIPQNWLKKLVSLILSKIRRDK